MKTVTVKNKTNRFQVTVSSTKGPFMCYVMQWRGFPTDWKKALRRCKVQCYWHRGVGGCQISKKKRSVALNRLNL